MRSAEYTEKYLQRKDQSNLFNMAVLSTIRGEMVIIMLKFIMEDIEDIILGMANMVEENRYLRDQNLKLESEVNEYRSRIKEDFEQTQKATADMLYVALSNAHYNLGDMETAKRFADKIS